MSRVTRMPTDCALEALAEDTLLLRLGTGIDLATNARVHAAARALRAARLPGMVDIAPAYATLLLRFEPAAWVDHGAAQPFARIATAVRSVLGNQAGKRAVDWSAHVAPSPEQESVRGRRPGEGETTPVAASAASATPLVRTASVAAIARAPAGDASVEIPVCYGGEFGPDLDAVAAHARLPRAEVIARHSAVDYTVAMLGFAPGFPYLLGLDAALRMPRRASPRTRVPSGSVAIGGAQTGIYPRELPGGWQLIGRTPLALFEPQRDPPCLLAPGTRVRFRAIDAAAFTRLAKACA